MSYLAEPVEDHRIPARALGYVSEATRDGLYDLVARKFMESGISQATLAKRLNKSPAQICRTLGASGNWTIDTFAELLFAIDGSMLKVAAHSPLRQTKANMSGSLCLADYHDRHTPLARRVAAAPAMRNEDRTIKAQFESVS